MKKTVRSLGSAIEGIVHAFRTERNLRHFVIVHAVLMIIILFLESDVFLFISLSIVAAFFVVIELFNTSIERLTDTIDDLEKSRSGGHYHAGIKMAKDVAAAASLVALTIYSVIMVIAATLFFVT